MNKKCINCGVEKPNTLEFFRKSHGDKLRNGCRDCEREYNKKYRDENPEIVKEASRRWREQNEDKVKAYNISPKKKEYYGKNKEKINKYGKEWYEKNKEEINLKRKEMWRAEHPKEEIPEGMKKCSTCKVVKPATNEHFSINKRKKDGFGHRCKQCRREAEYWNNTEEAKTKRKEYYENNKEKVLAMTKRYREENEDWYQSYKSKYYEDNKEELKEKIKHRFYKRIKRDPGFKLLTRCRTRIYNALKGRTKSKRTTELIGCSVEELMSHLERQFKDGMTWDNYGEWHVDHIKPCAMFDFTDEAQQRECFHYSNLQPLWAEENQRKSAKYEEVSD